MIAFDLGVALLTVRDENGFLGVQHDPFALKAELGTSAPDELLHCYGFQGRPLDPENGRGCSLLFGNDGHEGFALLANDPRLVDKIPPLPKGGSVQYSSDGSFSTLNPETHTWSLYVPYATGKAHLGTVGNDGNGKPIIEFASGTGAAWTLLDGVTTLSSDSGATYLQIGDEGINAIGPFKATSGADIGGPGSVPLVKAPGLATELQALQTALTAVGAALTAIAGVPVVSPAGAGPAAAAVTAIGLAQAALAAFNAPGVGPTLFVKGA